MLPNTAYGNGAPQYPRQLQQGRVQQTQPQAGAGFAAPQGYPSGSGSQPKSRPTSSSGPSGMTQNSVISHQQHLPHQPQPLAPPNPSAIAGSSNVQPKAASQQQPAKKPTVKEKKSGTGAAGSAGKKDKDKKDKKTRSRLACLACKSTKQKCDGPSRVPCRRCELYGLECKFPPSAGVVQLIHEPGAPAANDAGNSSPAVAQKLYEIAARLHSIENALNIGSAPTDGTTSPRRYAASSHSASHAAMSDASSDDGMDHDNEDVKTKAATFNAMSQINMSIEAIKGRQPKGEPPAEDYGAPDVIRRGVLTPEECQELFEFIHPWVMMLSLTDDRNAMGVRSRSTLLFHTVLVLSTSYSTPFPSQLHTTLVTFVNNLIAPQILSPQPHELTTDFLRALDLLNIFKMTQFATRRAEGLDISDAMRASKVNGLASWMMQGILARTAERLDLAGVLSKFTRARNQGPTISPEIIRDLRLYYWLLSNDVHGNVQSGRRCNMEGAAALTTTRLFSSLQLQPYDTRLAASVEMFEIARPILRSASYERTRRIARPDLERYNHGMAAWEEFWVPILQQQLAVDPLALSVMCPFAWFITLQFNAAAYVSWKRNRFYVSDSDGGVNAGGDVKPRKMRMEGARGLTQWEYEGLHRCVRAAEGLVFTLSEESRIPGGWRAVQWEEAERSDGYRKLVMDETVVELSKWGMDAITCVAYIFPLVFLCKLVNEGLLTADLTLLHSPQFQKPWSYTQKLPRLLELGAAFQEAISMNEHHPARTQAQVLRTLLETGVKGSQTASPQLPRHAATVMSPLPSSSPALYPVPSTSSIDQQPWQGGAVGNGSVAGSMGPSPALMQFQQQQQLGNSGGDLDMRGASFGNGMDQALSSVLVGFDPLFGDNGGQAFWDWGQFGTGADGTAAGGRAPGNVDWAAGPV